MKFSVELNSAPKQNTRFSSSLHIQNSVYFLAVEKCINKTLLLLFCFCFLGGGEAGEGKILQSFLNKFSLFEFTKTRTKLLISSFLKKNPSNFSECYFIFLFTARTSAISR